MREIKISVIVAINNGGKQLSHTLDSIRTQTLRDIEVILLDAASVDGTDKVMKQYLSDKRFSYIYCDDTSISNARNIGIDKAKGKYVAFGDSNVVFSPDVFLRLYECAEKEKAELCIAPMTSTDIYGEHNFSSSRILSKRRRISKFDTDIIWNPAVTNKLFLKSKIKKRDARFICFGKAREAAFTIPFAFESEIIAACNKGRVCYVAPAVSDGVSEFPIEYYLKGYEYIISHAENAFSKAINESVTPFEKKEMKKLRTYYIDQIYSKELTVLLYSYYRHFWLISDDEVKKYAEILNGLVLKLSPSGRGALLKKNKDIFYSGKLAESKKELADNPKVSLAISESEITALYSKNRLEIQLSSIYSQTMPSFELFIDSKLKAYVSEKWKRMENIHFIECESIGQFRNISLMKSRTGYIMYLDGYARLNPKHLMRHYLCLAGKDKYGFSTCPISYFDGEKTQEYSFTDLIYRSDKERTRVKSDDYTFAFDLFFVNKLFRTEHLRGIHFNFSDNSILDMYKLYTHSRFKKLVNTGVYFPFTEQETVNLLMSEKKNMPVGALNIYKNYRKLIFKNITLKKVFNKIKITLSKTAHLFISLISRFLTFYYSSLSIKDRVFFYSTLEKDRFNENLDAVYNAYEGKKVIFRKTLPHSLKEIAKIRKFLLTSKVIVVDCNMEYLRGVFLRKEQKVIQLWHKNGAFRRFGLDRNSIESPFKEYKNHSQYSDVIVTSDFVRQFYAHAFGVDPEIVRAIGSASSDCVVEKSFVVTNKEIISNKHPLLKNKKVYVYFPTYRENEGELYNLDPKIDWAQLNKELDDDEIFVVSRHPLTPEKFFNGAFYSRVKDYTSDPTNELLCLADVIVTDYSSIIFEASLLNKPTVFYCPDYGEFDPDFYLDYEKDLPGEIIKDSSALLGAVRRAYGSDFSVLTDEFRKKFMGSCDGRSTERVIELIKKYIS